MYACRLALPKGSAAARCRVTDASGDVDWCECPPLYKGEIEHMTPDQLRAARAKLGLSTAALAKLLRLGAHGGRTVRRWEAGDSAIPGPAQVAIELLTKGDPT